MIDKDSVAVLRRMLDEQGALGLHEDEIAALEVALQSQQDGAQGGDAVLAAVDRLGVALLELDFAATKQAWFEVRRLTVASRPATAPQGQGVASPGEATFTAAEIQTAWDACFPRDHTAKFFAALKALPPPAGSASPAAVDGVTQLRDALSDLLSWFPDKPSPPEWRIEAGERGADDAVAAARAALAPRSAQEPTP